MVRPYTKPASYWLCIKAFQKKGYKDVKPRENVLTYNLWVKAGRKVKEGEHAIRVANLRLFHVSQTEPMAAKERTAFLAKLDAKAKEREAKASGKVVPLGPSAAKLPPVELVPQAAPKKARRAAPTNQPSL
jgi:N-terminal domain of anti-restriction factor ArdC